MKYLAHVCILWKVKVITIHHIIMNARNIAVEYTIDEWSTGNAYK